MILSREAIQRMTNSTGVGGIGRNGRAGGGGGEDDMSNYATLAAVENGYISKDFFNQMFETTVRVLVTDYTAQEVLSDTTRVLEPNEIVVASSSETDPDTQHVITTTMTITGIQAKAGLWTPSYLSALGQNTGGGGGGAVALTDLVDVAISNPTNGQVLMYNSTTNKWYNGTVQSGGGSVTSITAGTGLSGGTITSSGTIAISTAYQEYINEGHTAYGWGDHAQAGYLTGITSQMVINALGYTPVSNETTWWGRSVNNNVVVGNIDMNNGDAINFKNSGGTQKSVLTLNQSNILIIGYGTNNSDYATQLRGAGITFYTYYNNAELNVGEFSSNGRFWIKQGAQGLRIGDGLITWDSTYNALKVQRISSGSVVDGGLYATSFISALGANASGGGGTSADSGLATSYTLPYTTNETYRYWHKLGTYQMNTDSMCLIIDLFSGSGYNGYATQNSWARIFIKKGHQDNPAAAYSVGITCEQFGYPISSGKILVRVNATAYNTGEVWVKCPWGYPKGSYSVQGNFTAWTHNNTTSGDSTTAPSHNQNDVGYYDNTTTMTTGE